MVFNVINIHELHKFKGVWLVYCIIYLVVARYYSKMIQQRIELVHKNPVHIRVTRAADYSKLPNTAFSSSYFEFFITLLYSVTPWVLVILRGKVLSMGI